MKNDNTKALDELFTSVGTYKRSADFWELMEFIARFPKMSPYNAMLIHIQRPGCRYLLTAKKWWEQYERLVNPYARPLVILRPFGPVSFVFDVADTHGKPLPSGVVDPFPTSGNFFPRLMSDLRSNLYKEGVRYYESDYGPAYAGSMTLDCSLPPIRTIQGNLQQFFRLMVNKNLSVAAQLVTIAHELGHMFCGHLGSPLPGWLPERDKEPLTVREFEAESVAWLVSKRAGIESHSSSYLSEYLDTNGEIPHISLETVLRAVNTIEEMLRKQSYKANKKLLNVAR